MFIYLAKQRKKTFTFKINWEWFLVVCYWNFIFIYLLLRSFISFVNAKHMFHWFNSHSLSYVNDTQSTIPSQYRNMCPFLALSLSFCFFLSPNHTQLKKILMLHTLFSFKKMVTFVSGVSSCEVYLFVSLRFLTFAVCTLFTSPIQFVTLAHFFFCRTILHAIALFSYLFFEISFAAHCEHIRNILCLLCI